MSIHPTMECQQYFWPAVRLCYSSWWIIQCQLQFLCLCMSEVLCLYQYPCWLNPITYLIYLLLINFHSSFHISVRIWDISTMVGMTSDKFALMLVETCKLPDIQLLIKNSVTSDKGLFTDLLSTEVPRQTQHRKEQLQVKDSETEAGWPRAARSQGQPTSGWYTRGLSPWQYWRSCSEGLPDHESISPSGTKGHLCVPESWSIETGIAGENHSTIWAVKYEGVCLSCQVSTEGCKLRSIFWPRDLHEWRSDPTQGCTATRCTLS